jgi:hypothetical protein
MSLRVPGDPFVWPIERRRPVATKRILLGLAVVVAAGGLITCGDEPTEDPVGEWITVDVIDPPSPESIDDNSVTVDASAYLARYAPTGELMWATPVADNRPNVHVFDVALLEDGSTIVAGTERGLTRGARLFTARYDAAGSPQWHVAHDVIMPRQHDVTTGAITALEDGGFMVTTRFVDTARFVSKSRLTPDIELEAAGSSDGFIARLDANGYALWASRFGGPGSEDATDMTALADGGTLVVGHAGDHTVFGAGEAGERELTVSDGTAFVAKWKANGTFDWVEVIGDDAPREVHSIAAREDGSFVVAGTSKTFMPMFSDDASADVGFVASHAPDGAMVWSRLLRSQSPSPWTISWTVHHVWNVAIGAEDSVFAVGDGILCQQPGPMRPCNWILDAGFVLNLEETHATSGPNVRWRRTISGGLQSARTVAALPDGGAWVTGEFEDVAVFSNAAGTLLSLGTYDGFLARYDAEGEATSIRRVAAGEGQATTQAVGALADGSVVVIGNIAGEAEFAPAHTSLTR